MYSNRSNTNSITAGNKFTMAQLEQKAKQLGATEFGFSRMKDKRYYVIYEGKRINFGSKTGQTFLDHRNKALKDAWYARHSQIKNKQGEYVINLKTSPDYWSANILW